MSAPRIEALLSRVGRDTLAGRLTRTLILWVGGVWLACVLAVVWYTDREITFNFDNELIEVSHRMFDIALSHLDKDDPAPHPGKPLIAPTPTTFTDASVIYQIVDPGERVLMRSAETPGNVFDVPVSPGFSNNDHWRIYTVRHPVRNLYLQVADPLDERREAVDRTLIGLIAPLLAILPLLAVLLRRIARSELGVLQSLEQEIGKRGSDQLQPISLPRLPRELKSVEEHVNRLMDRLSKSLDVERALAANAAHELRTPLAAARLRLQTALDHDLRREDVRGALDALQVLSHRTEKLLQLSRAESGASLTRSRVDLILLAATVAQEFWADTGVLHRLHLRVPETGEGPIALGDFDALAIALRNLVENALHYAGDSRVDIEVRSDGALIVRDGGPGVGNDALALMRQRHVRHGTARVGYGLGLSIVTTIVEKHGGRLEMQSPPPDAETGLETRILLQAAA
ncbi:sensor histidine kinase [Variovorax sp. RHLX14]|uniref:sensor histidine kinase n=1 Tax=Variovorax sp. RHLX14 TaxID=1259731 RepID=UPI003F47BE95